MRASDGARRQCRQARRFGKGWFDLYESHDLFVSPSLYDSAGFAFLEALFQFKPIASSERRAGPRERIDWQGCAEQRAPEATA